MRHRRGTKEPQQDPDVSIPGDWGSPDDSDDVGDNEDERKRIWGPRKSESEETRKLRAKRSDFQNEMESMQNDMWNNMVPSSSQRKRKSAVLTHRNQRVWE